MKRVFDIIASITLMIVLAPLLVLIAVMVRWQLGKPVLFLQVRPGKGAKPFTMMKFRTMRETYDADGNPLPDTERLTRFGHLLRSTSLDELPELWNVLKGDMSLVGPRPLLMEYLPLYSPVQARRHEVRPGITGWAQVKGRNSLTWEEKFDLDLWYVENVTFLLDVKILFMTIAKVLSGDGVNAKGDATMPRFRGSNPPDPK